MRAAEIERVFWRKVLVRPFFLGEAKVGPLIYVSGPPQHQGGGSRESFVSGKGMSGTRGGLARSSARVGYEFNSWNSGLQKLKSGHFTA